MNRGGVCYDVGRVMWGQDWRPEFSPEQARRELQIIRDDLHCNAVRICGQDPGRLTAAGGHALGCGLQVWLSPELWDHSPATPSATSPRRPTLRRELHRHRPDQVVFSVGSEATLFMAGIVEGTSVFERLEHPEFWKRIKAGEHNGPHNVFLAGAAERAREVFHGPVTYASVPLETVEWSRFDFVSVDLYLSRTRSQGQTTWDIYDSLLRQGLNTQRRFVHAKGVTRAACRGEQMRWAESSGNTDASDPSHSLWYGAFSASRCVSSLFCYVLQTRRQ